MPLAHAYRFTVFNGTGQTIAANAVRVKSRRWKFSSTGSLVYEGSEVELLNNGSMISNSNYSSSSTIDNSSDLYIGGDFSFHVTAPSSANGDVLLYYDRSTDGGSTWNSNGLGTLVCVLNFTTSGTKIKSFSIC